MRALRIVGLVVVAIIAFALFEGIRVTAVAPIVPELTAFALVCAGIGMLAMWHPR